MPIREIVKILLCQVIVFGANGFVLAHNIACTSALISDSSVEFPIDFLVFDKVSETHDSVVGYRLERAIEQSKWDPHSYQSTLALIVDLAVTREKLRNPFQRLEISRQLNRIANEIRFALYTGKIKTGARQWIEMGQKALDWSVVGTSFDDVADILLMVAEAQVGLIVFSNGASRAYFTGFTVRADLTILVPILEGLSELQDRHSNQWKRFKSRQARRLTRLRTEMDNHNHGEITFYPRKLIKKITRGL